MSGRVGSHRSPVRYNNRVCKRLQTNKSAGFLFVFEISHTSSGCFYELMTNGHWFSQNTCEQRGIKRNLCILYIWILFPPWHFECIALLLLFLKNEIFSLIKWLKRSWPLFCLSFRCVVLISKSRWEPQRGLKCLKHDWQNFHRIPRLCYYLFRDLVA